MQNIPINQDDSNYHDWTDITFNTFFYSNYFKLCTSFYNTLCNYDIDSIEQEIFSENISEKIIYDSSVTHSENSPLNIEIFDMLKYIAYVKISYQKATSDTNLSISLNTAISFNKYGNLINGIYIFLLNALNSLCIADSCTYKFYPLKQHNIFFDSKILTTVYNDIINSEKSSTEAEVNIKARLSATLKYYNLNFLENELFSSQTDNKSIRFSVPTASILSFAFLLQTYVKRNSLPIHIQYMIISDSVINISVAKKHDYYSILNRLLKIRTSFQQLSAKKLTKDKRFIKTNALSEEDATTLCSSFDNQYYISEKQSFELKYQVTGYQKRMIAFRKLEHKIFKENKTSKNTLLEHSINNFFSYFEYDESNLQPLPSTVAFDKITNLPTVAEYDMLQHLEETFLPQNSFSYCPTYFQFFFC